MKFKTDENLPIEAAATLREAGFDAETIWDEKLSGADDHVVARALVQIRGRAVFSRSCTFD